MTRNGPLALLFHTLFVIFMLAPILAVCFVAFTPEGYLSFPTNGLSLRWFRAIARYPEFITAFWTSIWLGAVSSTIALGLSVPAALAIARYDFTGREAFTALLMSPLMIPHVVLGIAFLRFFTQIGLGNTFLGLVLAHIVIVLPFALRLDTGLLRGHGPGHRAGRALAWRFRLDHLQARHVACDHAGADDGLGPGIHPELR